MATCLGVVSLRTRERGVYPSDEGHPEKRELLAFPPASQGATPGSAVRGASLRGDAGGHGTPSEGQRNRGRDQRSLGQRFRDVSMSA